MGIKAGYARLSRDEDGVNYESIEEQINIITKYYKKNLDYHGEIIFYIDDNYSGYIFERPDFQKLNNEIEKENVDIVITKDLSRIGRNNPLTLLFFEKIEDHDTRVICIGDGIDTINSSYKDTLGIFTWHNEHYVRDISRKINQSFKSRQEKGSLIISVPYGYKFIYDEVSDGKRKRKINKKIVIDEFAAEIVREVFKLYIEGCGYRKIAKIFNEKKYPTPSVYKKIADANPLWTLATIKQILECEYYIGTLPQGKTYKKKIKGKSFRKPEEEILKFENHHEPIISKEEFELVKKIQNERNKHRIKGTKIGMYVHLFAGKIFCGKCGKPYVFNKKIRKKKTRQYTDEYYLCGTNHKLGAKYCKNRLIQEKILVEIIKTELNKKLKENLEIIEQLKNNPKQQNNIELESYVQKVKAEISKKETNIEKIYLDRINEPNLMPEHLFKKVMEQQNKELEVLQGKLNYLLQTQLELEKNQLDKNSIEKENQKIEKFLNKELNRGDIELILDKIIIDDTKEHLLDIYLNF